MTVSARVREIESQIDASIHELPIWQAPRAQILEQLMHVYRDAVEVVFCKFLLDMACDSSPEDSGAAFIEDRFRSGALWALKWALEYCPERGLSGTRSPEELVKLIPLGMAYEAFVDALKYAQQGLVTI